MSVKERLKGNSDLNNDDRNVLSIALDVHSLHIYIYKFIKNLKTGYNKKFIMNINKEVLIIFDRILGKISR